ncbi:MAG: MarR family transcriptional regulator [Victivallales bacterium]|jgi:DNA-binding MarR family transcriptional regulator|nr:MarR family transcriptional regulator [Victivallales bacterium]MBT7161669.1 MarR family transcriptional regulator [Victivallales bacterium]MBT7303353.1 MarR family transcriptional regulator [Victivallales bacterium]
MRHETEIELMKRVLGLTKAPYVELREAIQGRHAEFLLLLEPGRTYRAVDLARRCNKTPSAISHVLKDLMEIGLVERKPGEDLRSIAIEMTPQGVEVRSAVQGCIQKVNDDLLSALSPGARADFRRALEKLVAGAESA